MAVVSDKRERLLNAAKRLIHQQGYTRTTLGDIARAADVPPGNVYYYFKTKEDVARAVIHDHADWFRHTFSRWDAELDPRGRLLAYAGMVAKNCDDMATHGCPVGSLCAELDKQPGPLTDEVDALVRHQLGWVTDQFRALSVPEPETVATDLIARLQGTVLVSHALGDASVLARQVAGIKEWIRHF